MANRSYLFSINNKPEKGVDDLKIKGVSEYRWQIPLIHLILIGKDTEVCRSVIWNNQEIALVANYDKGLSNLKLLIELLKNNNVDLPGLFEERVTNALDFLEDSNNKQQYFLLEAGEVLSLSHEVTRKDVEWLLEDAKEVASAIEWGSLNKLNAFLGADKDLAKDWQDILGLDSFSKVLWYSFK